MSINKKSTIIFAALLILGGAAQFVVHEYFTNLPKTAPTKYGSIVRLVYKDQTFCSGTVVNQNLIITAGHCVIIENEFGMMVNPEPIEIRPADNSKHRVYGHVNYATPQMDQAMLVGNFTIFEPHKYTTNPERLAVIPKSGARNTNFVSCGYPLGGDLYCSSLVFDSTDTFFWAAKGILLPGMSGGPTMLSDGTMVGVNVAVRGDLSLISPIYNLTKNINVRGK